MSIVVTRLFDTYEHAKQAVGELEAGGIPHSDISIVASNQGAAIPTGDTVETDGDAGTGAGTGATIGTVLGGGAGLLAGLGMLAIPGVGPVVAAGWLIATAVGAGGGAGAGGLLGSLVGAGVDEADAHVYAEGVRRGGTLVTARVEEAHRTMVEGVMDRYSGVDAATRGQDYRAGGWEKFDEMAPPYEAGGIPPAMPSATIGNVPPVSVDPVVRPRTPTTGL
ncbi:MAG: hypothetical protein M3N26_04650 [Pseudomonadota bacterium]|nr:hypothetical protein [Pseudomonadota bacterium]